MLEFQQQVARYQVFTSQNYPYSQKHSGGPLTEIATLKCAFFVEPPGVDGGVNPLGHMLINLVKYMYIYGGDTVAIIIIIIFESK